MWIEDLEIFYVTSVLHDVEEGDHDAGDGLELRRRLPPPLRVHHRAQRVVEDPPPHRSLDLLASSARSRTSRLASLPAATGARYEEETGGNRGGRNEH